MAYHGRGDAAAAANKLTALSNDVAALRHLVDSRFDEMQRLYAVDIALRAGALDPEEAVRLLARPDARTVVRVVAEVAQDRLAQRSSE